MNKWDYIGKGNSQEGLIAFGIYGEEIDPKMLENVSELIKEICDRVEKIQEKWIEKHLDREQVPKPHKIRVEEIFRGSHDDTGIFLQILDENGNRLFWDELWQFSWGEEIYYTSQMVAEALGINDVEVQLMTRL